MRKTLPFICALFSFISYAQPGREAWHWRFGQKGGLDFSSGQPVPEPGLPVLYYCPAGVASVSDPVTGQYLFSTNGGRMLNKNNAVMHNGHLLAGVLKADQHLIVPKPGSTNTYYAFTTAWGSSNNLGIHYHAVDMQQQNGLGTVAVRDKQLLKGPTTARITAVRHCNGLDYWIITHKANSDSFFVFKVSNAGVDTIPVISTVGVAQPYIPFHSQGGQQSVDGFGVVKASPNGRMLAISIDSDSLPVLEVFNFDNSSGVISNPNTIVYPGKKGPYGISFSPDSRKLYAVPSTVVMDTSFLYQYDVSGGNTPLVASTETLIKSVPQSNGWLGDLQIGPDGKIYIPRYGKDTLAVITDPNNSGVACNFQLSGLKIPGYAGTLGLPNLILSNSIGIQLNVPDVQLCSTFTTSVVDAGPGFSSYQWNTGATTQTISISAPGQYWVTVTNDQGCQRTDTVGAYVLVPGKETILACDTFHANVTQGGVLQYNWYDGGIIPIRDFTTSGQYWVDINYVGGCGIRDSIDLTVAPSPQIDIGPDSTFCKGNLPLSALCSTCNYQWSTGAISSSITATTAGTYWVKVTDSNGCVDSDTLLVNPQLGAFSFEMPNIVTPNDDNINDVVDFGKYQFSSLQIAIYNRWGQQVFSSNSADAIWKPEGEAGTYFYTAQYKIDCGMDSKTKDIKGFITLVR